METVTAVRAVSAVRAAWGAALTFKTDALLGAVVRDGERTGTLSLFARTVGIRDLVFGLGALVATFDARRESEIRRWLWLWLASDLADVYAGATASRKVGPSGSIAAAAAPLPFVAAGAWALRRLARSPIPA